jgi:hypothetical protein
MTVFLGDPGYPKPRDVPMPAQALLGDFYCEIGACRRQACPKCSATGRPAPFLTAPAPDTSTTEPAP